MRSDILSSAILCNVPETVKDAVAKFKKWMEKGERTPPNLREVIYSAGIKYGGEKEWEYCWTKYKSTGIPSERKLLLKALGMSSDPWILKRYSNPTTRKKKKDPDVRKNNFRKIHFDSKSCN